MAATYSEFLRGLYEEHLEEASFLYDQRRRLLTDAELSWTQLADFEDRLEAHLDALVVGGDAAADACRRRTTEGDPGELFAAVSAFCRRRQAPLLAAVLKTLDYEDRERTTALTDALKYELPDEWEEFCVGALATANPALVAVLATTLAYRRLPVSDALLRALQSAHPDAAAALLWGVGRTARPATASMVGSFLRSDDRPTAAAAAYAALRLQSADVLGELLAAPADGPRARALAVAGGRRAVPILLAELDRPGSHSEAILALGLLGDLAAVRPLVNLLSDESAAGAAAEALYVITGAPLFEEVIVPDEIGEEELFPGELEEFRRRGELPRRPDGQPFGTVVRRLSRNASAWAAWLTANASRFIADRRYRSGALYSPAVLLECLKSTTFPKAYRAHVGEELLIRYAVDIAFDVDLPVRAQYRLLRAAESAIDRANRAFDAGRWYFAGRPI